MGTLKSLLAIPGSELEFGTIEYKRSDGYYSVKVKNNSVLCKPTISGGLELGRKVLISKLDGKRYITGEFGSYQVTARRKVIVDG